MRSTATDSGIDLNNRMMNNMLVPNLARTFWIRIASPLPFVSEDLTERDTRIPRYLSLVLPRLTPRWLLHLLPLLSPPPSHQRLWATKEILARMP